MLYLVFSGKHCTRVIDKRNLLDVIPGMLLQSLSLYCCSLFAVRFLAVRHITRCSSWRLAASAVPLFLLVMRSSVRPRCSHCWTVPFCHSVVPLWIQHGLTVPSFDVLLSRLFWIVDCPLIRVLVVVEDSL